MPREFNVDSFQCHRAVLKACSREFESQLNALNLIDLRNCDADIKKKRRDLVRRLQVNPQSAAEANQTTADIRGGL